MVDINDIRLLKTQIKNRFSLCSLMANKGPRASEKETMIAQTIHACEKNYAEHGACFSQRGQNLDAVHGGGLADNPTAYAALLRDGYFAEESRKGIGKIVIPTPKLIQLLKVFFKI